MKAGSEAPAGAALTVLETAVAPAWVDYNGHMNDVAYAGVFSQATDALMEWLGMDAAFRSAAGYTIYTLESHIRYRQEAHEGDGLRVEAWLADHDAKRLQVLMRLCDAADGTVLATGEQMLMGIDTGSARPAPFPAPVAANVDRLWQGHALPAGHDYGPLTTRIRRR
ncbi:thioesterase family protein [Arhodomonas aquaeolei]|uniref:thioesterase family protein n=1 Tax=Arhodomonas aquaeolei TaxID=2369 RepID=UPI000375619B|nr:thioesterase family protein [Arhodomonas aquaeolei]